LTVSGVRNQKTRFSSSWRRFRPTIPEGVEIEMIWPSTLSYFSGGAYYSERELIRPAQIHDRP
jgi:hypothetical protein